jgi:hypothetical protein
LSLNPALYELFLVLLYLLHGRFVNSIFKMLFFMDILLKLSIVNNTLVLRTPQLLIMSVSFTNPFMVLNKPLMLGSNVLRLLFRLLVLFLLKQTLLFLSFIFLIILPIFYYILMT